MTTTATFRGTDGELWVTDEHLTVRRDPITAQAKGAAIDFSVPWASVIGARVATGLLWFDVAGLPPHPTPATDPLAVVLALGQEEEAAAWIAEVVTPRAAGAGAVQATLVRPAPAEDKAMGRLFKFAEASFWVSIFVLAVPLLVIMAIAIVVLFIVL
jgi:hypothetical protein